MFKLATLPSLNASKSHLKVAVPTAILNSLLFCNALRISLFTAKLGKLLVLNFLLDGIALLKKDFAFEDNGEFNHIWFKQKDK